jgi:hypothetical protein
MSEYKEHETVRKEIEAVLEEYGISSTSQSHSKLTPDEFRRVRDIATQIIHGNIDKEEISKLNKILIGEISAMVQYLMSLKKTAPIRDLQEINPYYTPFSSRVIRDGEKKGDK